MQCALQTAPGWVLFSILPAMAGCMMLQQVIHEVGYSKLQEATSGYGRLQRLLKVMVDYSRLRDVTRGYSRFRRLQGRLHRVTAGCKKLREVTAGYGEVICRLLQEVMVGYSRLRLQQVTRGYERS